MRSLRAAFSVVVVLSSCCTASATLAAGISLDEARELYRSGRIEEAIEAYRRVAAASEDDPETAGTARNNACVILMNTGDRRAALEECEQALRLRHETGDPRGLARAFNNVGLVLQHLGRFSESEERFREALAINLERGDTESQVINLANLGVLATQAGWYAKALEHQRRALEVAERHRDAPWSAEQRRLATINLAVVFERLGAYEKALERYRAVLDEQQEMRPRRRAALLVNLGVVYRNLGDPIRALRAFQEATGVYEASGDTASLSNAWLNVGIVHHLNLAEHEMAERTYRTALRLAERSGDRSEEIQDLYHLGRLLLERQRASEAQSAFARCLAVSEEAGAIEGQWRALEGLARVARSRGELKRALGELRRAIDAIERVRGSLARSSLRSGFLGEKRHVYAAAVEVLAALERNSPGAGHAEEALVFVQRAKARVLLDSLGPGSRFAEPLDAATISHRLGGGALLEYFVGEENLFAWHVRRGRLEMRVLGPARPVLDDVAAVHRSLAGAAEPPAPVLRALSETLLRDAGSVVEGAAEVRIAPDGGLHHLPFEILPVPGAGGTPLVEAATVSYLPSGSALGRLRRPARRDGPVLLGFGAPELPADVGGPPTPASLLVSRFDLSPLPAAADELAALGRWFPGEAVFRSGQGATEEAFRRLAAGGFRVVHLISHTVLDERPASGAAILLSRGEDSDGVLRPEEIATLDYPVDLTVLAACRTALGPDPDGNPLATLTGSFLAAGSSGVVATLWDVGDAETRAFMEQFYFQLQRGHAPAVALRRAKQRFRHDPEWSRTDLWAAYVLVGDPGPIVRPGPVLGLGRMGILAAAFAAVLLGWLARRRLRRPRGG